MSKMTKQAYKVIVDEGPKVKFGVGKPSQESACNFVHVFVRVVGLTVSSYRVVAPPETRLDEIGSLVSKRHGPLGQTTLEDEGRFEFLNTMRPVTDFSNKCALNVSFAYPVRNAMREVTRGLEAAMGYKSEETKQ